MRGPCACPAERERDGPVGMGGPHPCPAGRDDGACPAAGRKELLFIMGTHTQQIIQRLWNYCNILRDDGMSYGDYVEQLTYLLFLKMADERTKPPHNQPSSVPAEFSWASLVKKDGDELFDHYRHVLEKLGNKKGLIG